MLFRRMDKELPYYLAFSHFLGIGPMRFNVLLTKFKDVKSAYESSPEDIKECIGDLIGQKFLAFRSKFDPVRKMEELKIKGIRVITQTDPKFPPLLKNISDPPICLYVKGNINHFEFETDIAIGIVGTRMPTSYGEFVTEYFASKLTHAGCVIVSGMAMGIDGIAHATTLREKGRTIAVLGCGVDIIYPLIHTRLYEQVIKNQGLVISEFPPGQTVRKGLFIARNRIISGLSKGILVIEGSKDSGSLITAKFAAEQGRDVFAPPAPLNSHMSEAPNFLLKEGAKFVTDPNDILEEYHLKNITKRNVHILSTLSVLGAQLYKELLQRTQPADELAMKCEIPIREILSTLSQMEIEGTVKKNTEGNYEIVMHA